MAFKTLGLRATSIFSSLDVFILGRDFDDDSKLTAKALRILELHVLRFENQSTRRCWTEYRYMLLLVVKGIFTTCSGYCILDLLPLWGLRYMSVQAVLVDRFAIDWID